MDIDLFLTHHGIKGMKWGVRNASSRREIAGRPKRHSDSQKERDIRKQSRKGGVKSLSTEQLKTASDRLAAEQRYSELKSKNARFTKGHNVVKTILAVGGTITAGYALATSPATKAGVSAVSKLLKK